VHIDILARQCERTTSEVLSVLLTLEIMGVAKQLSGKMFVKMSA
jgi:predicted Rossmann fold nucleotide-binding protein DprA/Smf involved in DNA uptake